MAGVCGKFVSKKVRNVSWRPVVQESFQSSNAFVLGSWDDEENSLSLWTIKNKDDKNENNQNDIVPKMIDEIPHLGDVTDLKFMNSECLVASSSTGSVSLYKLRRNQKFEEINSWKSVHSLECTGIAVQNNEICTVGEDGKINIINSNSNQISSIENADSCTITSVMYIKHHEIITTNVRGQLKSWDIRSRSNTPSRNFFLSGDQTSLLCLNCHPTQSHVVATGGEDGMLCVWDVRQDSHPVSLLSCHESAITDVKFHPTSPDNLFTCSLDGSVWHWNGSSLKLKSATLPGVKIPGKLHNHIMLEMKNTNTYSYLYFLETKNECVWLNCDATKHRLDITSLLPHSYKPINCLDVNNDRILCGSDSEVVYIIDNIIV
ncbi:Nucleoporin Nup43 [Nymphon striatum]|nr:Nucleoporin Nup43 [Nymphon striatum]